MAAAVMAACAALEKGSFLYFLFGLEKSAARPPGRTTEHVHDSIGFRIVRRPAEIRILRTDTVNRRPVEKTLGRQRRAVAGDRDGYVPRLNQAQRRDRGLGHTRMVQDRAAHDTVPARWTTYGRRLARIRRDRF